MHRARTALWSLHRPRAALLTGFAVALLLTSTVWAGSVLFGPLLPAVHTAGGEAVAPAGPASSASASAASSGALPFAAAKPALSVAPTSGPVGTEVNFSASGFPHAAAITIDGPNATLLCAGTTSSTGTFACESKVPALGGGPETFTGTSKTSSATAQFTVAPVLVAVPASGPVGSQVVFRGTGFGGKVVGSGSGATGVSYPVAVSWTPPSGGTATICSTSTSPSGNGSFSCSFVVPAATGGSHAFLGRSLNVSLNATADFLVLPALTVGPSFGPPATHVTFSGTGYQATGAVSVLWTGGTACSNTSDQSGNFSCAFTIPSGTVGGAYTFSASNTLSSASASFVVTFLQFAPTGGPVGTPINATGGGFTPGASIHLPAPAGWSGPAICPGVSAGGAGSFSCSFDLPATAAGTYVFNASAGADYATASLSVVPALALSRTYGDPLTPVTFSGTGFGSTLGATVSWAPNGTAATICSVTTAANGSFSCSGFKIPSWARGGAYTITATDSGSHSASNTFVVTFLTVTPSSGPRNSVLHLSGGGFAPGATVNVTWPPGAVCSKTTSTAGNFTCTFTESTYAPAGANNFTAQDGRGDTATAPYSVTSHLGATPVKGGVGSRLSFSWSGFAASALVRVEWANGMLACSNTSAADGAQNCSLLVPAVPAGTYTFTATDPSHNSASAMFNVTPTLTINRTAGIGGTPVRFNGTGFGASTTVQVSSSLGIACSATSAANGSFSCTYTIPIAPSGSYVFTASDQLSNEAAVTFSLEPQLTISASTGSVGYLLTFTGNGFAPGGTATVSWSPGGVSSSACDATVLAGGSFSCEFTVPQEPMGSYTFTAHDTSDNSATASFSLVPALGLTPPSGPVGTIVQFQGVGFLAAASVTVSWSGGTACGAQSTNSVGTFSCQFTIPATSSGPQTFTASSSATDSASATFQVTSTLVVLPIRGPVGTTVTINGTGLKGSAQVTVAWSGGTACVLTTPANGSFSCTYVIPATPAGVYAFTASVSGQPTPSANFSVQPRLTVTPSSGPSGTAVVFRASGFASSVSISISAPTIGATCSGATAANGSFSCPFTIPAVPSGSYGFTATDTKSNTASAAFAVGATASVSPALGPVGTALHFTGTGFSASSGFTVTWSGGTACSGTTGPAGGLSCNTTMPAAPLGSHVFTVAGGPSVAVTFTVKPALSASPSSVPAGSSVALTGSGFPATDGVTVTWLGTTSCSATTNASGGFSCSVTIPRGTAGGVYAFTATDTFGDTANATFLVVTGLSVTPNHGPAPRSVTFYGSNFAPSASVSLTWGSGTVCSVTTNVSGGFSCPYTVPATTAGGTYTFTATDSAHNSASVLFTVTYLALSPNGVEIGTVVTVGGGGFEPGAAYTVRGPWGVACNGTVEATGEISCPTTIPTNASPGVGRFQALDADSDIANASFGVFAVTGPTAVPGNVDLLEPVTFSVTATGGPGGLTYTWNHLPSNCSGSTPSISCQPNASVTDTPVTVTLTDSAGFNFTTSPLLYSVYANPEQAPPSPSVASADVGGAVTFTAKTTFGAGGGTYSWSTAVELNCSASTSSTISCRPTTVGSFSVSFNWTDSNGRAATGSTLLSYAVHPDPTQAPPTASQASADVGQTVTFTAVVHNGSTGGSYAWTASSAFSCAASTAATVACLAKTAGSATISFVWTDADAVVATGKTTLTYPIDPDPVDGAPIASAPSADVNQSVTFTANASGGAGGFTYRWVGLPSGCPTTGSPLVCAPTAANASVLLTVVATDANGFSVTSPALAFVVYPDPVVAAPRANVTSADVGQAINFSVLASGGSGGLTYAWVGLPPGCTGSAASITCVPTQGVRSASITVRVTDSDRYTVTSPPLVFTVYFAPDQAPPSASTPSADVGQGVVFTAKVANGSGGGTYAWTYSSGLNCTASTSSQLTCRPVVAGSDSVSYGWTDSNGVAGTGTTTLSFTVFVDPTVGAPHPSPSSADVNGTVQFVATPSGGSGGFTYVWTASSALFGCAPSTKATVNCTPTESGQYTVHVVATDSNGVATPGATSAAFTVYPLPRVTPPVPSRTTVDTGQPLSFTTTASGGSGPLSYVWAGTGFGPLDCTNANATMIACTPKSAGVYTVTAEATDPNGGSSGPVTSESVNVSLAPTLTVPTAAHTGADIGEAVTFSTTPTGGSGGLTYTWTASADLRCVLANAAQISCHPNATGNYTVTVSAVDSNGGSSGVETSATFRVYPMLVVSALAENRTSADVGQVVGISATATGGLAPYSYAWVLASGLGCPTGKTVSPLTCTPTAAGTYRLNVTITDANGGTSGIGVSGPFVVYAKPVVTLSVSPSTVLQGKSVTFVANASLGAGTLTFSWVQLPDGCPASDSATITCTPSTAGTYTVAVSVTDTNKVSASANTTVTVQPSLLGLPAIEGWAIVIVAVLVGLGLLIFVVVRLVRKRRGKRQELGF